jgi:hypothetical protein
MAEIISFEKEGARQAHALCGMHVGEAVVHHISEEDDCVWTFALHDAPRFAQIHIDEDPGYVPKERTASRVGPLVENLWIGDEEDVSRRLSISLRCQSTKKSVNKLEDCDARTTYCWIWPSTAYSRNGKDTDFEPQDDCNPGSSHCPE